MAWRKFHQERAALQRFLRTLVGSDEWRSNPEWRSKVPLMPIFVGFPRPLGSWQAARPAQKTRSYTGRTILLNFASAAPSRFRFVLTVTILQQAVGVFVVDAAARNYGKAANGQQACPESRRVLACQRVGQGLALFPYLRRRPN